MSAEARRSALGALHSARPAVGRMDLIRGPDQTRADITEAWGAVESALRALVSSSGAPTTLTGQSLIRETRQRQLLTFDQANSLAEFEAAHARVERAGYQPTEADVNAARTAFLRLETALMHETPAMGAPVYAAPAAIPVGAPASAPPPSATAPVADNAPTYVATAPRRRAWVLPTVLGVIVIAAVAAGLYFTSMRGGNSKTLDAAIAAYGAGQREAAANGFTTAVREDPKDATPHVYLARMAREAGNMTVAYQELQQAVTLDPNSGLAQREMGSYLMAAGNYPLASKFYVRAIEADTTDKVAMGWLGCAMLRMNRIDEAQKWMMRAGAGSWSTCTPLAQPTIPR